MIDNSLSNQILTIGAPLSHKGGIAQVLNTYRKSVFPTFKFVSNGGGKNKLHSVWIGIRATIQTAFILLFDRKIKIVHIHTASYKSFWHATHYERLSKFFGKKVVLHIHGGGFVDYYYTNPEWIKKQLSMSDCVVTLSAKWKAFFKDIVGCSKVEVVNNIVGVPLIKNVEKASGLIHLLFLGVITEKKGIFDLVEMMDENKQDLRGKVLLHIGGKGKVNQLIQKVSKAHIEDMVKFEGWITGDKKIELLNMCDIFILPSYVEGLPISILEAMSYGKIVITTPVGGIPDLINENNGYLFQPGDKKAMYVTIKRIINNRQEAKAKAAQGQLSVESNMPENVAYILTRLYSELMKN